MVFHILFRLPGERAHPCAWNLDHAFPFAYGGSDSLHNLQILSAAANAAKGSRCGWDLLRLAPKPSCGEQGCRRCAR